MSADFENLRCYRTGGTQRDQVAAQPVVDSPTRSSQEGAKRHAIALYTLAISAVSKDVSKTARAAGPFRHETSLGA